MLEKHLSTYKSTIVVLLILLFTSSLNGQNTLYEHVQFDSTKGSTKTFLALIEKQSEIVFSYTNQLCFEDVIELSKNSGTVREILNELFMYCPAQYIVKENKIIIKPLADGKNKFVLRGFVRDATTKESLIQANIYDPDLLLGTVTNNFGYFSISLPAGFVQLNCSYVGYKDSAHYLNLTSDTTLNFNLRPSSELEEVAVIGNRVPGKVRSTQTGTVDVPIEQIKNVPVFLGEVDIVKSIQLLPGIQSGSEGFSDLYVRGGGPDQNLILMDDVPVYNVSHFFGFFSIFNADAVNNVKVIKGGFPARYGGRLSSVVDIRMYDGNNEKYKGTASVGLLSSRVAVEGPLIKDKSSFSVSFRRTYVDLITSLIQLNSDEKSRYYFYDYNMKFNYKLSDRDRLYFSGYAGKDEYGITYNKQTINVKIDDKDTPITTNDEGNIGWRNYVGAIRWNRLLGNKMFANTTATFSDYRFFIKQNLNYLSDGEWSIGEQEYFSGIKDFSFKTDIDYLPSPNHYIRFGGSAVFHSFLPGSDVLLRENDGTAVVDTTFGNTTMIRPEYRAYVEDDLQVSSRFKINIGGHFSMFKAENKYYWSMEPRVSARYLLLDNLSLKAAYSKMTQYMHLLRTAYVAMPTDLWLPVSDNVKPMRASQSAIGFEYEFFRGFNLSIEAYYKRLNDILAYKENAGFFDFASNWQEKLTSGNGKSYGFEVLLHRKFGDLSGWFGYTYSKSTNQFDELNGGKAFPANFDRTHDASVYLTYKFNENVTTAATWTFGTGNPFTLPETKYYAPGLPTESVTSKAKNNVFIRERNSYRMPSFHRLDLGINFSKEKKWGSRTWSFGLMNTYGRQNPFFLYFDEDTDTETGEMNRSLMQFSLFPIPLPYARLTVKF